MAALALDTPASAWQEMHDPVAKSYAPRLIAA